ncbi:MULTISPECIES: hypothetical protein [unclassified Myxococcus]|uniref:hypothetical protein n=1 Tax=Myxococcus TaxID=32 RepID=UPI001D23435C|nr:MULTISPECIES: hypothetical protein [unclassified Myxococcus]MBZ4395863.1 hypothetical protein [Myxococcus sp. AS-1-15]MBZ4407399.1 hypothetical protein [Myxococcus sp. XM-1-1-1]
MNASRRGLCALLLCSLGLACGEANIMKDPPDVVDSGTQPPDGGGPDAGPGDAGAPDSGTPDAGVPDAGGPDSAPITSARVFFSGHSLLDNPMPDHFADIAASKGKDSKWNQQNVIGSPIRVRTWGNGSWEGYRSGKNREGSGMDVVQELLSPRTLGTGEKYDTLLITERHDLLGTIEWENTIGYLRHFHDRLIAGNPRAVTYFYHTWLDIDKANPSRWIAYEKNAQVAWECVSSKVNLTLQAEGRADRVRALPGGAALVDLVERVIAGEVPGITGTTSQRLNVLFSDNVHLTNLGAYFMAAVHHASVFRSSPEGAAGPAGANAATVQALQRIAWNFVSAYYAQPSAGERTMADCRTRIPAEVCPGFWESRGEPGNTAGCQRYFGNANPGQGGNPFVWPDPNWQPLPAP